MENHCQLIVNADDLGWVPGRDRGIFRTIEQGIVSSVSLFANGSTFSSAVRELKRRSVGIGVHFNLSEGCALNGVIRGLTDEQGMFLGKQRSRAMFSGGEFDLQAARAELHCQMTRVLDTGLMLDHIDSHQHMFLFPQLTMLMVELCQQFNITACRLPFPAESETSDPPAPLGDELHLYRQLAPAVKQSCEEQLFTPDGLWGMPLLNRLDEAILLPLIEQMPDGCWELMVHPGEEDEGTPFCGVERCRELQALTSASVQQAVARRAIHLTTFGAAQCAS